MAMRESGAWPLSSGSWFVRAHTDSLVLAEPMESGGVQLKALTEGAKLSTLGAPGVQVEDAAVGKSGVFICGQSGVRKIDWVGKSQLLHAGGASLVACEGDMVAAVFRSPAPSDPRQLWSDETLMVFVAGKWQEYVRRQGRYAHAIDVVVDKQGNLKVALGSVLQGYPLRSVVEVYGTKGKELEWEGAGGTVRQMSLDPQLGGGFVACGNTVARFDKNGRTSWRYDCTGCVVGLLVEEDGGVTAGVNNGASRPPFLGWLKQDEVVRIGSDGSRVWSIGFSSEVRSLCNGPTVKGKATVVVCTASGVTIVDSSGRVCGSLPLNGGARIARTLGQHLYVIAGDWVLHQIEWQEQQAK
ncbi:MAG: hypothetical protein ACPLPR_08870 [Bacillota bacterium]